MKSFVTIFFLFFTLQVSGQPSVAERTGYVCDVTFFIESKLFLSETVEYYPNKVIVMTIPIISPRVKVGVPTGSISFKTTHRIDYRIKEERLLFTEVEYRVERLNFHTSPWNKINIKPKSAEDSFFILVDTLLEKGNSLKISFKKTEGDLFQIVKLQRISIVPAIHLFRETDKTDTTLKSMRGHMVNQKTFIENFTELHNKSIQIEPGHLLELVFANQSINNDSSILYRLRSGSDSGRWQRTGHFALLKELKSNKRYILEVKYDGSDSSNTYKIEVLPKWYQTSAALFGLGAVAVTISMITVFIWLRLKLSAEKRKKEQLLYRLKAVHAQLNPHFIFNALSSIQALINTDKKKEANQYLNRFSTVLRGTLKNSDSVLIPLVSELELLKDYLDIEQLRFQFLYEIRVDGSLNLNEIMVAPMLFQPSIENSIKHGISEKAKDGVIIVTIKKEENGFTVRIFDNGKWKPAQAEGYGISLTKKRIAAANELNKTRRIKYLIDMAETGTTIQFQFENWFI